jgi:predicted regulator of Ras-like GTPase activity (Roadblock/LC7/MglB family)
VENSLRTLAEDLARMTSVEASVIVAADGTVVADTMDGDAERAQWPFSWALPLAS